MALFPLGILSAAGAGGAGFESDYELITTQVLGSNQPSITFSSLGTYSSTYKHLQIRMAASTNAGSQVNLRMRFNGDTGANYAFHYMFSTPSTVTSAAEVNFTYGFISNIDSSTTSFLGAVSDILDPYSTSKNKTMRTLAANGSTNVWLNSTLWRSTSSVTSIELFPTSGNLITGSRFSLYGIKG
jgi:hypothetical protein